MKTVLKTFSAPYAEINYTVSVPEKREGKLPMMVFLHGAGERGSDPELISVHGLPKYVKAGAEYDAIVLSPQCPAGVIWPTLVYQVKELIDLVAEEYDADPDRISCTGISMGGYGTWEMGIYFPDFFSAIAPCCGGGVFWRTDSLKHLPIWACHGDVDRTVPVEKSLEMVDNARKFGNSDIRLTLLHGVGHGSWEPFYEETRVIEWLLAQKRGEPARGL